MDKSYITAILAITQRSFELKVGTTVIPKTAPQSAITSKAPLHERPYAATSAVL